MEIYKGKFAPEWLARVIFDSKIHEELIEIYVENPPSDVHGRLVVVNNTTNETFICGDRYMSSVIFLASYWTIKDCRFSLVADHVGSVVMDTRLLECLIPPEEFIHAQVFGEAKWEERKERLRLLGTSKVDPLPGGHFETIWVPDE